VQELRCAGAAHEVRQKADRLHAAQPYMRPGMRANRLAPAAPCSGVLPQVAGWSIVGVLLGRVRASMIRAGVNESTATYYPLKRFKRAPWKRPAVLLGE
jgi:hypothetical protein